VRLRTTGDGGSCDSVSIVRSDRDGLDFRGLSTFSTSSPSKSNVSACRNKGWAGSSCWRTVADPTEVLNRESLLGLGRGVLEGVYCPLDVDEILRIVLVEDVRADVGAN
jgi:hypothetical protein